MGRLLSDDDYDNMLSHDVFDEDHIFLYVWCQIRDPFTFPFNESRRKL